MSDTNQTVQRQSMARGLKYVICAFVFPYAKSRFSHDVAHIVAYSTFTIDDVPFKQVGLYTGHFFRLDYITIMLV